MCAVNMLNNILLHYNISSASIAKSFGNGLINHTWLIRDNTSDYILQKVNTKVFDQPVHIAENTQEIAAYLADTHPEYLFVTPINTHAGKPVLYTDGEYWRLYPFVKDSVTVDVVPTPELAFEAARQFGLFTKNLSAFPAANLHITLPDFHNLILRYRQFSEAIIKGNPNRISVAKEEIEFLSGHRYIVSEFQKINMSSAFKLRVTHHDTKISNVLFSKDGKGLCVIDLDTVMPGYFISDVGDMIRTYLSPVSEEEKDFSRVEIRDDYFKAVLDGYLTNMASELTAEEIQHFVYAGSFMIYMQALRFLTDFLNDDIYYGAAYKDQNFVRARNQIALLQHLLRKETLLNKLVREAVGK